MLHKRQGFAVDDSGVCDRGTAWSRLKDSAPSDSAFDKLRMNCRLRRLAVAPYPSLSVPGVRGCIPCGLIVVSLCGISGGVNMKLEDRHSKAETGERWGGRARTSAKVHEFPSALGKRFGVTEFRLETPTRTSGQAADATLARVSIMGGEKNKIANEPKFWRV